MHGATSVLHAFRFTFLVLTKADVGVLHILQLARCCIAQHAASSPCCCRLSPSCEELAATVGGLLGVMASMLCSLPLLCSEASVRQWRQQAGSAAAAAEVESKPVPGRIGPAGAQACGHVAEKQQPQIATAARLRAARDDALDALSGKAGGTAAGGMTHCRQTGVQGSHTLKARNARLEVLLAASGALEVQV